MCSEQLQLLNTLLVSDTIDQPETLNRTFTCLRSIILTANQVELTTALAQIQPLLLEKVLRKAINSLDDTFGDNVLDTFRLLLQRLSLETIDRNFGRLLDEWMNAPVKSRPKQVWLQVLGERAGKEATLDWLTRPHTYPAQQAECLLQAIVRLIGDHDQSVSKAAHQILFRLVSNQAESLETLFDQSYRNIWQQLKTKNEIVRLRVFDLMICLGNLNETTFDRSPIRQSVQQLMEDIKSNDALVSLNCVHLLNQLVSTSYGSEFLKQSGYFEVICQCVADVQSLENGHLMLPTFLQTFALMSRHFPSLLADHQNTLTHLIQHMHSNDESIVASAIDALAIASHDSIAKLHLDQLDSFRSTVFPRLGHLITSGSEITDRSLACLSALFEVDDLTSTQSATVVLEQWYTCLRSTVSIGFAAQVVALCRKPFRTVRLEAFNLLRILCTHPWSQKDVAQIPNIMDYLLNRSTELDKEGKEAKFAVIRELIVSPYTIANFGRTDFSKLKRFYNQGPLHIDMDVGVAVKGAH